MKQYTISRKWHFAQFTIIKVFCLFGIGMALQKLLIVSLLFFSSQFALYLLHQILFLYIVLLVSPLFVAEEEDQRWKNYQ